MDDASPILRVPEPNATVELTMEDGAVVLLRRHGNSNGPRLALSHGNGLAIDAYLPFWGPLCKHYDVIVFDVRNHGRNPTHQDAAAHCWSRIVRDFERIHEGIQTVFGKKRTAGLFHSLSSIAAIGHSMERGPRWDPLILFDPPIFPREGHPLANFELEHMGMMGRIARGRPRRYSAPEVFAKQLQSRSGFARWVPGTHLLFAQATLCADDDKGDWRLACPREYEASIFESNVDPSLWSQVKNLDVAVKLIGADPTIEDTQAPALLTQALAEDQGIPYDLVADTSHFLQIERPDEVRRITEAFLAKCGMGA